MPGWSYAPRPCYRIFRAAWVMARAFTPHLVLAPLALPWTFLSVIPGTLRRGLYLDPTRTGLVMLYRSNRILAVAGHDVVVADRG